MFNGIEVKRPREWPALWRRLLRVSTLAGVIAAIGLAYLTTTDFGERLELRTHDLRFRLRPVGQRRKSVVIVAVGDESARAWPEPSAFWGAHHAALIRQARAAGARVVGLDFVPEVNADAYLDDLNVDTQLRPDIRLAQALVHNPDSTILGYVLDVTGGRAHAAYPSERFTTIPSVPRDLAFLDLPLASDHEVRETPIAYSAVKDVPRIGFAASLASRADSPQLADGVKTMTSAPSSASLTRTYLDYSGSPIYTIEALSLEAGKLSTEDKRHLRDAVVLIGPTYAGVADIHDTPIGPLYGVEVHAEAVSALLDGRFLRRLPPREEFALTLLLGAIAVCLTALLPPARSIAAIIALEGIAFLVPVAAFLLKGYLFPMAGPLLVGLVVPFAQLGIGSWEEWRGRRRVEGVLGRYVSPEVRDYLLQSPSHLHLGGAQVDATVLFLDIRGSLLFAETRSPEDVIAHLNGFFAAIVPVLDRFEGTLLRYTGDGFLAVFGAPRPLKNHAQAATDAAFAILDASAKLMATPDAPGAMLPMGCGIHTGSVLFGNLGVSHRSEYTLIGDVVNRASRLESLNKKFASVIVLSAATHARLEHIPARLTGPVPAVIAGSGRDVHDEVYYYPSPVSVPYKDPGT